MIAKSIGINFARYCNNGATGVIHSVFTHTVNIELDSSHTKLLTLVCHGLDLMSCNLEVHDYDFIQNILMEVGDKVLLTPDMIYINSIPIIKDIKNATRWERISNLKISKFRSAVHYTSLMNSCDYVERLLTAKNVQSIEFPKIGIGDFNPQSVLGLGNGLTPSGDDFLAGMLHGLHFMEILFEFESVYSRNVEMIILQNMHRTGSISQHFLSYALNKEWGLRTENFLVCLIKADQVDLIEAVEHKLRTGSTSGFDELMGCLYGIRQFALLHLNES